MKSAKGRLEKVAAAPNKVSKYFKLSKSGI